MPFPESAIAHRYLDGLEGLEIGGSANNPFGLRTRNVDLTDSLDTPFKQAELRLCGRALPVDLIADGAHLPVPDQSVDFVVSSHVLEHFWDPIAALHEWARVARRYLLVIIPHRDALPSDRDRPVTPVAELLARHAEGQERPLDHIGHATRWTVATFLELCTAIGYPVVEAHERDDKVGNGHLFVIACDTTS